MSILTDAIREDPEYSQLLKTVRENFRGKPLPIAVSGLCDGAKDAFLTSLFADTEALRTGTALILCADEKECLKTQAILEKNHLRVGFYMMRDLTFYHMTASHEYEHERLSVLSSLSLGELDAVVTTADAAIGYTIPPEKLEEKTIRLSETDEMDVGVLSEKLVSAGFVRVDLVESPGQFALRGGIVDIYPPGGQYRDRDGGSFAGSHPLRIEFFGDTIDRMGLFDPETQRMIQSVTGATFVPSREILTDADALDRLKKAIAKQLRSAGSEEAAEELSREAAIVESAKVSGTDVHFLDKYISLIYPEKATLLDYFDGKRLIVLSGNRGIRDRLEAFGFRMKQLLDELRAGGTVAAEYMNYAAPEKELYAFCDCRVSLYLDAFGGVSDKRLSGLFGFKSRKTVSYEGKENLFLSDLLTYVETGYRCIVETENAVACEATEKMLAEADFVLAAKGDSLGSLKAGTVAVLPDAPTEGFELTFPRIAVLSLAGETGSGNFSLSRKGSSERIKKHKDRKSILSYADLEIGDIVVHEDYGIGRYMGLQTMTAAGVTRDYVYLQYAGTDKLYLQVDKLDKLSKYIGAHSDDGLVKLSKISGDAWKKSKARASAAAKDMAKELIKLYAERMRRPGYAFQPDDKDQKAFEDAFPFTETESQEIAADEIKADMMKPAPMDRLLCGDVGYGKTEVALRAAYKAILGGKQVAILVPTTLLALQHYQTIQSRMRAFAVNVEMLSRFRSPKQQTAAIRRLERGESDIVVGTHRLLSKDVKFHDLGLVIVDEEQRFGVAQKEKLKQISAGVDVLSLSATPIPRTLNMAMGGIRDISVLDEAPNDRLPVQTYVLEESPIIIEEAIRREMRRGGQIFYLHNSIETIYSVASALKKSLPDARITVAHGQMEQDALEDIWEKMIAGEIDILVCTTIIETGVDVPNANTLIVSNAHRLGLSQLHQIRGRIGRSSRRGYAYFTYPRDKALPEIARKRLEAIREYAEFGAGFKIALRDMEIRGAGNLLGAEQHGHLDAVGYDLYIKLLNMAVLEEKGEKVEEKRDCTVSFAMDAFLPDRYVPYPSQRMALYKKIALIANRADFADVNDELIDRFGEPPKETETLLQIALIHSLGVACKFLSIREDEEGKVLITPEAVDFDTWSVLAKRYPVRIAVSATPHMILHAKENRLDTVEALLFDYLELSEKNSVK